MMIENKIYNCFERNKFLHVHVLFIFDTMGFYG